MPVTPSPPHTSLIARRYRVIGRRWRGLASTRMLALDTRDGGVPVEVLLLPGRNVCGAQLRKTATARGFDHLATAKMRSVLLGDRACVMVLDVSAGEPLAGRVAMRRPLSVREVVVMTTVLLSALQAAHRRKIFDNDLSLEALRYSEDGQVAWTGLGLGWLLAEEARRRGAGTSLWAYLAPRKYSPPKRDLYALAVALFCLAVGLPPPRASRQPGAPLLLPPSPSLPPRLDRVLRTAVTGGFPSATAMSRALLDLDAEGSVAQAAFGGRLPAP